MLPYGRQSIEEDDIEAVAETLRSDFLTTGPTIEKFEAALCDVTGAQYAVVCSSGTAALHLSGMALGLGAGDAVIVPALTFLATANAVRYSGAEVVFADVDPDTGLMGPDHLEEALKRCTNLRPRAVFPVHMTGQCVDMPAIKKISDKKDLKIVADSCHALGVAGSCADEDMSAFSFHPVKAIAMGEGGAITTNNKGYADAMRMLRSHGMVPDKSKGPWFYEMNQLGYNYRCTDFQCALGLSQLKKLPRFLARRQMLAERYDALLGDIAPVRVRDHACHLYSVRINFAQTDIDRIALVRALQEAGIGTQVHYIPVHTQPYYKERYGDIRLPGAEQYYERTLSLPLFPGMKDEDVDLVANTLIKILEGKNHDLCGTKNSIVR